MGLPQVTLRYFEGAPGAITEVCAQAMIQRSFPSDELAKANGMFMGLRQLSLLAGNPLGINDIAGGCYIGEGRC